MIDISFSELGERIWTVAIKPFWWSLLLALVLGFTPIILGYFFKWLKKRRKSQSAAGKKN